MSGDNPLEEWRRGRRGRNRRGSVLKQKHDDNGDMARENTSEIINPHRPDSNLITKTRQFPQIQLCHGASQQRLSTAGGGWVEEGREGGARLVSPRPLSEVRRGRGGGGEDEEMSLHLQNGQLPASLDKNNT